MNRIRGYTLIEVVLAVLVVAISVSATLVVMNKMVGYTAVRGYTMDKVNAVAITQYVLDEIRDRRFPPTSTMGRLDGTAFSGTIRLPNDTTGTLYAYTSNSSNGTEYNYTTTIRAYDPAASESRSDVTTDEYDGSSRVDSMLAQRSLLEIKVEVYRGNQLIMRTVTYKTRNGYY
ncbi:MAG TPA: prepilin-type N-terminal cleavage/methylation domain-containing protein [bacterium]|nr:prepilin-type N-terminal cleavage/methylation domain-containing protein [bacterium]HNS48462.1 prepilin-type N-terminal cleavage/methylation domain-containing protein [bacterium]